ncbi:MAG: type I DNA topoisomerase [Nitrospirae bacterium]|nr:type I DNA topoisomerase [Nitrospirota bacterium]
MAKPLIIVESPAKARTITKYLGKAYNVMASVGHVRDLPTSKLGVDIENDFTPHYITIKGKGKILTEIKKAAGSASKVFLGPDPDREGEAIAWHIAEELRDKDDSIYRVMFHEITEKAIKEALSNPGRIDTNKVNAQQARRILDRIVGYKLSPLLWEKVRRGLSAGRVQSVAVRLICDLEKEISQFVSEEYWSLTATLEGKVPPPFKTRLIKYRGEDIRISDQQEAERIKGILSGSDYIVKTIDRKERKKNPQPPFTTSKLQQEAARKLRFTAKKTMLIAQKLYEGMEIGSEGPVGLITYMRTDSVRISADAQGEARKYIKESFGGDYLPAKGIEYKNKKGIQDAHEAIRPTSVFRAPEEIKEYVDKDTYNLYRLIWNRFVACQMNPALLDITAIDIQAGDYLLRATGSVIKFPGFMKLYEEGLDDAAQAQEGEEGDLLPSVAEGERLNLLLIEPKQHFTQPPARYTEASLIKILEEKGIGRPSTYAAILSTIQDRKYVEKKEGRFHPTDLGVLVNDMLVEHFPELIDVMFTAKMEDELDEIEEGHYEWRQAVGDFYRPFDQHLEKARKEMRNVKVEETPTDIKCEKCGNVMVIKWGKLGHFLACSGYPECKNTMNFKKGDDGTIEAMKEETTGENCPQCGSPMVIKSGRFGRFFACSNYPECKTTRPITTGIACPQEGCGGELTEKRSKRGKVFYSCTKYPSCKFAMWDKPVPRQCPQCGAPFLAEKFSRGSSKIYCIKKECGYKEE